MLNTADLLYRLGGKPESLTEIATLARWVRSGKYRMLEWTPMLPATTPASQMGILHGTIEGIPAFRWVERSSGRVFVANKPKDAADIVLLDKDLGVLAEQDRAFLSQSDNGSLTPGGLLQCPRRGHCH